MFINGLDNIRLIDEISINERTIVSWYDKIDKSFSFCIFHLTDQPNTVAKLTPYCMWGYITYVAPPIVDPAEASEVYSLYLKDLIADKNWWEDDNNLIIPDEVKERLKQQDEEKVDFFAKESDNKPVEIKPKLTLVED